MLRWFTDGLRRELAENGHSVPEDGEAPGLVIHVPEPDRVRPYRRQAQGTFVVSVISASGRPPDVLKAAYPLLVKTLSNLLIYLVPAASGGGVETHFVTLEQGSYPISGDGEADDDIFPEVYRRLSPLAQSRLVINNVFEPTLPRQQWQGDDQTRSLAKAGARLDALNLLPAPFPLTELLNEREMAHVLKLFGLGGLSYGNLSVRHDADSFWMSARGVDKSRLGTVGKDILLITGYLPEDRAMVVSVPEGVEPRSASVDAIEHWMLYTRHPPVGAIIHIHAWMEGIKSTRVNYPCGTQELAQEVADLVAAAPDPSRAVVGLRNHGLTITGRSLEDIFERIEGRIQPQVPME